MLKACREAGIFVIHTREGHRADLSDLPRAKYERGNPTIHIGDEGPMGRLLVRGLTAKGLRFTSWSVCSQRDLAATTPGA